MKSSSIVFDIKNRFETCDEIISALLLYKEAIEQLSLSNMGLKYQIKYKIGDIITDTDNIDDFAEDTLNKKLLFYGMQICIHSKEGYFASIFAKRKSVIFPYNTTISSDNFDHLNMLKKSIQNKEIKCDDDCKTNNLNSIKSLKKEKRDAIQNGDADELFVESAAIENQKAEVLQEEQKSLETLFKDNKGDYKCKEVDYGKPIGKEIW